MDLFEPVVEPAHFHPNFTHALNRATQYDRDVLQSWAEGFVDRDGKFIKEFQTTFNSSFWELYLFAALKELGLPVDLRHGAPDFVVGGQSPFCVEAVTASNAATATPEWMADAKKLEELELEPLLDGATLRLANAVSGKYRKYQDRYAHLGHVADRPFLLALAPFEQPFFWSQNTQAINRVLYTFDRIAPEPHPVTGEVMDAVTFLDYVEKPNGSRVPLGYFARPGMPEISAVLFSNTATWGKVRALSADPNPNVLFSTLRYAEHAREPEYTVLPRAEYRETLLDGLCVFHNPYASRPLAHTLLDRPGVTQYWLPDPEFPIPDAKGTDGSLLQRYLLTLPVSQEG